jgi:hypothetical protein
MGMGGMYPGMMGGMGGMGMGGMYPGMMGGMGMGGMGGYGVSQSWRVARKLTWSRCKVMVKGEETVPSGVASVGWS